MRRNPFAYYLAGVCLLLLVGCMCAGCGSTTTYNITFEKGAFRVAEKIQVEPPQGGSTSDTGATGAETAGGTDSSPGGSNLIDGFANQANIFQIGTSAKPTTTTETDATVDATVTP